MKTLLKNILLNGRPRNILIDGGVFVDTDVQGEVADAAIVDCASKAILPSFFNTHTHSGMMSLRGGGDDLSLKAWLNDYVWPREAKFTPADIHDSSEAAAAEMTSTGTCFFNDMYFEVEQTVEVVRDSGMRACIGITMMDNHPKSQLDSKIDFLRHWSDPTGGRIQLAVAPHAIYTVGPERLVLSAEIARECGVKLHIHLSETKQEVDNCLREHGMTPVRYLDSLGVLGPNVIAAHCVWVDEQEWDILAERGVSVAHCPCSNMKIGSGRFPFELAVKSGACLTLATDSASSNNNLDMREEMKFAALLAKVTGDPELLPAAEIFKWATLNGAKAFGIKSGKIEKGWNADAVILDAANPRLNNGDLVSNWVYSADCSCIEATLCAGEFIYRK
ncbi:MAG: amidohydrolase [Bacteroidales bacterium]|nr:amidohydrolase [Bacteroidales bacterium]